MSKKNGQKLSPLHSEIVGTLDLDISKEQKLSSLHSEIVDTLDISKEQIVSAALDFYFTETQEEKEQAEDILTQVTGMFVRIDTIHDIIVANESK
jgi:hypothetical protein